MIIKRLLFLLFLLNTLIVESQTDTITYGECEIDTIPVRYDKVLKYFLEEKEDIKHLWKFNAVDWGTLKPSIGFEHRIKKSSSIEAEIKYKPFFAFDYIDLNGIGFYSSSHVGVQAQTYWGINLAVDYRYYYNKKRRALKGKNTNGFSGNYVFFGEGIGFGYSDYLIQDGSYYQYYTDVFLFNISLKGGYGIQRRIGNIGYVDFKFGINYDYSTTVEGNFNSQTFSPFVDINIGLALKSLKRPIFK